MRGPWEGRPELRGRYVLFVGDDVFLVFSWGPGPSRRATPPRSTPSSKRPSWRCQATFARRSAMGRRCAPSMRRVAGTPSRATPKGSGWLEKRRAGRRRLSRSPPRPTAHTCAESARVTRDGFEWLAAAPVEALAVDEQGRLAVCRRDGVVELRDAKNGWAARDPRTRRPLQPRHVLRRGPSALHRGLGRPVAREPSLILR